MMVVHTRDTLKEVHMLWKKVLIVAVAAGVGILVGYLSRCTGQVS